MKKNFILFASSVALCVNLVIGQNSGAPKTVSGSKQITSETLNAFKFRSIGPALTSGRVVDLAVNPVNPKEFLVAAASAGVWKTNNAGQTFEPIFENEGSYSIGCVRYDPGNPNVIWVGSGENNNQRSVAYGDGVYKSVDGGKSWKNMGLKNSEHTGMIAIHPTNGNIVYVAAYGPLWSPGGDRGIYKTNDGGKTWKKILNVSENTGFNEVHLDPRNPDIIYACAHQRRRQVFTYISGGPESNLYRSKDGGQTWDTLSNGLPSVDKGRIGLSISPVNPDVMFAVIEAADKKGGVFRSADRGESWEKVNDYSTAGNYYGEIFCDPKDVNKVFIVDFWIMVSTDGGKSFSKIGEKYKHVDNHALWIDPQYTDHLLAGCDGGLYETFDYGSNWSFKANLPITQFYKVAVDQSVPFYNVYGGTQDNNSLGGPSRTMSANGITNSHWFFTQEGDGFESAVDPDDPNIVYCQSQYGGLGRFNKKTGELMDIKPVEKPGEPALRWNWDSPIITSKHKKGRIYFGANKLFKSDDRGNSWTAISPDLSRQTDRNKLPVMGKVWSMDAVAKNQSTDFFGQIVTIAESMFDENYLLAGTDDGLIQISNDGGKNWQKIDNIPGVPAQTYVNQIISSAHDKNVFYAAFNHHRYGDFKPYLFKSNDGGKTWQNISSNLPVRGSVYCIAEDHVNKDLLFAGTEFGVYCSLDGGKQWAQLKSGLPTIAVRDIAIQTRENDLVLATFGRGFYILDDYSPLRVLNASDLDKEAFILPIKDGLVFNEWRQWGSPLKGFQGESFYAATNPEMGVVFTCYLKEDRKSLKEKRQEKEKERIKKGLPVSYPPLDSIRLEDDFSESYLLFTIYDESGAVVRKIKSSAKKGLKRIVWDFRYASPGPVSFRTPDPSNPYDVAENGHLAMPGNYRVSMSIFEEGKIKELVSPVNFRIKPLFENQLSSDEQKQLYAFCRKVSDLRRNASAADSWRDELTEKIKYLKAAGLNSESTDTELPGKINAAELKLKNLNRRMNGDDVRSKREMETAPSINGRIGSAEYTMWGLQSLPTSTFVESVNAAEKELADLMPDLKSVQDEIKKIEEILKAQKAPYTPGMEPDWK